VSEAVKEFAKIDIDLLNETTTESGFAVILSLVRIFVIAKHD
jgi:hypothetical protein